MSLKIDKWKKFRVGDIFSTSTTPLCIKDEMENGNTPFISRTAFNNGCDGFVNAAKEMLVKGKCITVGAEGIYAFYQKEDFVAGNKVYTLRNEKLNEKNALFICTILNKEDYRYSYGRARILQTLENEEILLPVSKNEEPDWEYMEKYISSLKSKHIKSNNTKKGKSAKLQSAQWKEFILGDIFEIKKGKRLTAEDQTEGNNAYIGAIDSNNGLANRIGQEPIHEKNTITLNYNGSVGEAFYQPEPYWATDDVNALYFKKENEYEFNKYIALFICSVLKKEKYRFSYGRKWVLENMKSTVIKLPALKSGKPDWLYMENYIKALPYGDRI